MEKNSKKNEKAFTLIELLAVIVILAIIALIAVPQVLRIINQARRSAAEDSTYGVAETAQAYIADMMLANGADYPSIDVEFECNNDGCKLTDASKTALTNEGLTYKETLDIKGKKPTAGTVRISNGGHIITAEGLKISGFTCSYDGEKANCGGSSSNSNTTASSSFAEDSWSTIAANVRAGKTENYHVGDTKILEMDVDGNGEPEKYSLRIVNTTTPDECGTTGFSQTACGFVVEFGGSNNPPKDSNGNLITKRIINAKTYLETATSTGSSNSNEQEPTETATSTGTSSTTPSGNVINDIIVLHQMNPTDTNTGGWNSSEMRSYVNNDIYNLLPTTLKNAIIDTTVVSGHGKNDSNNFTTTDKLYLLSTKEVGFDEQYDTTKDNTRILDYYNANNNNASRIKKYNGSDAWWWLRSAGSYGNGIFYFVYSSGVGSNTSHAYDTGGAAAAFRIG